MTPTVHYDHEVTLKMQDRGLSQQGSVTISGVTEPIIGQRIVEQVITLKDGEPSILAGIITKQDNLQHQRNSGLGEIPFFKYFFTSRNQTRSRTTRSSSSSSLTSSASPILTRLNTRAIDTGTGQSIELRRDAAPPRTLDAVRQPRRQAPPHRPSHHCSQRRRRHGPAAQAAGPAPHRRHLPASPERNLNAAAPACTRSATGPGSPVSLTVVPPTSNQAVGSTFQVAVMLRQRAATSTPCRFSCSSIPRSSSSSMSTAGDLLSRDGQLVSLVHRDEATAWSPSPPRVRRTPPASTGREASAPSPSRPSPPATPTSPSSRSAPLNSTQANLPAVGSQAVVHVK